jgi:hypothetical protein
MWKKLSAAQKGLPFARSLFCETEICGFIKTLIWWGEVKCSFSILLLLCKMFRILLYCKMDAKQASAKQPLVSLVSLFRKIAVHCFVKIPNTRLTHNLLFIIFAYFCHVFLFPFSPVFPLISMLHTFSFALTSFLFIPFAFLLFSFTNNSPFFPLTLLYLF